MRLKIEIPTEIKDITLGKYQEFVLTSKDEKDENKLQLNILKTFCNVDAKNAENMKLEDTNKLSKIITSLFTDKYDLIKTFKLDGVEFGFVPNLDDMTLGEYIDLDSYMLDIEDLHRAMAVLYRPIIKKRKSWLSKKEEQYKIESYMGSDKWADRMKDIPVDIALGVQFFFSNLRKELLKNTALYLEGNQEVMDLIAQHNLVLNGDGTTPFMHSLKEMLDL
jgi:hypothetical protein